MTTSKAYSGTPAPSSFGGGLDFRAHCAAHRGIYGLLGEFPRFVGHPEQEIEDYRRYTAHQENQ